MRPVPAAAATALLGVLVAQDVPAPARYAAARARIAAEVVEGHTPALSLAVLEDDAVVWAEGFGHADPEHGTAASADTVYRLASISKTFTATALMVLVDRGRLDLDAPVNRCLDDAQVRAYRGSADDITLRRLCNHTAGLPTHWNFFFAPEAPPPRARTIAAYGFAAFPPGTRTNYSNLAFGIVDHVVERTAGEPFAAFLRHAVLDPLGLRHTDLGVPPGLGAAAAVGCRREGDRFVAVSDYGFDHDGASAVRSSARDLVRFARLWIDAGEVDGVRVLTPASARAMGEVRGGAAGSHFGIAWDVGLERGTKVLRHTGGMPGVSTVLQVFPARRAAVAVLTNTGDRGAQGRALGAVLDALLGGNDAPGPAPAKSAPQLPPAGEPAPPPDGPAQGAPLAGTFRGLVAHPEGPIPCTLTVAGDGAVAFCLAGARVETRGETATAEGVRLRGRHPFATGHGPGRPAELELELARLDGGLGGVLYATLDGVCRLPHWVQLAPAVEKPAGMLRVVTWNVLAGFQDREPGRLLPGVQRRLGVAAFLAAQDPDVVALQELDGFDEPALRAFAAAFDHPHVLLAIVDGRSIGLTSRTPIEVAARRDSPHAPLCARTAGAEFVVVALAPRPGVAGKVAAMQEVRRCYLDAAAAGRPVVVLGDFGSIAPADVDRFSAAALERYRQWNWCLLDGKPAEIALTPLLDAGAVDVYYARRPAQRELPLPRVDFVLASPDLAARSQGCRWRAEPELLRLSDHPPVVADFRAAR